MTPLVRTLAGLASGWLATKTLGVLQMLQTGHGNARSKKLTSRRSFTRNAALGATGIVTAQVAGGFVWLLWPNQTGAFGGEIGVAAANVPEPGGEPFRYAPGQFFLVNTEDDGVRALWWKCPHLGCTVPWIAGEELFICPCHGSVYAYSGERISGPAPYGLNEMLVTTNDDGSVTVDTNPTTVLVDQYQ
jgi:cytochrome b6-f complex iron-sulfur subunit